MNRVIIDRDVLVPMRDGIALATDIYRPKTARPLPVILVRLPYDKDDPLMWETAVHPVLWTDLDYAIVYQDTRGRCRSGGAFYPFFAEAHDGFDTVNWIAHQPWCNGAVGMAGASYAAATQWLAATQQPPALRAIAPVFTASDYYEGWTYQGGAFQLGFALLWTLSALAPDTAYRLAETDQAASGEAQRLLLATDRLDDLYRRRPLTDIPLLHESAAAPYYADWLDHPTRDAYWRALAINERYASIQVPALNIGGWFDLFLGGTLENFARMQTEGGSLAARQGQRLLIGPWSHGNTAGVFPCASFGTLSSLEQADFIGRQVRFFEHHLRERESGLSGEPPVTLFVMGENRWRGEDSWPLERTRYERWYLRSGGILSPQAPSAEKPDTYVYRPRQPAPTTGGPCYLPGIEQGLDAGPRDQRLVERRPDVLTYTSAVLNTPLEVTGPLTFRLWAATDAADTDFVVRLCDVFPDDTSRLLAEGIIRTRYRLGTDEARPVTPGAATEYEIDLAATSNVFLAGHRIRVDVTSSSFPRFDANANTGAPIGSDPPRALRPAHQTILHSDAHPSHILLPVIPR